MKNKRENKKEEGIDPSDFLNKKDESLLDQKPEYPRYVSWAAKMATLHPGNTEEDYG